MTSSASGIVVGLKTRFSHQSVEFNYVEFDEMLRKYANDKIY